MMTLDTDATVGLDERDMPAPALTIRDVGIGFRGVRALDAVSFSIPRGGTSAVIGPNGAGKTTLFNCISGIYRHEGEIELAGRPMSGVPAQARAIAGIARTFQTPALLPDLNVFENVLLGAHGAMRAGMWSAALRIGRASREERAVRLEAWDLMGPLALQPLALAPVSSLAHADRRRVEVARALLSRPSLLLLDEPAAGLSADEADELLEVIADFGADTHMTSLLVEHDVGLVMRVARFVAVLDAGRLLASGDPTTVSADPRVIAAYLGADAPSDGELLP
ncbi:ATP-binding cassette domain-containing protein [Microbacterium sp. zg-Y818]|uniref:ABC transporter ATP-binding protein n=1 Tax=unclassified Microbacterium TaxID=2609290 RepID=UPI00214B470C|nr:MULTISPECIES: ATP-binding cassette domain-containing protein [unclassified Microbacterium]MCR2800928.1 ATP-binding cassette domain-containing protein [Microbacterium sp. zg.Y818]WIM23637.1 ATP-binding cassette domain-containing protein [Microbacterium sp. zg-Y818]